MTSTHSIIPKIPFCAYATGELEIRHEKKTRGIYKLASCSSYRNVPLDGFPGRGFIFYPPLLYDSRICISGRFIPEPHEIQNSALRPSYRNSIDGFTGWEFSYYFPTLYESRILFSFSIHVSSAIRHCAHLIEMSYTGLRVGV